MRTIFILSFCVAAILGAPSSDARSVRSLPALEHVDDRDDLGQYTLKYVTAEGTIVSERGRFVPTPDGKDQVLVYEGEFTFVGDDGKVYLTKYKTDIDGAHQPVGEHLPKPVEAEVPPENDLLAIAINTPAKTPNEIYLSASGSSPETGFYGSSYL